MSKDARAVSYCDPGIQDSTHDGTDARDYDRRNADSQPVDQLARMNHLLESAAYVPQRRARPAMSPAHDNAKSLEERIQLFLEPEGQESGDGAGLSQGKPELWDESRLGTDKADPSPRSLDSEMREASVGLSSHSVFPAFVVRARAMILVAAAIAGALVFIPGAFRLLPDAFRTTALPSSWTTADPSSLTIGSSGTTGRSSKNADQTSMAPFESRFQGQTLTKVGPSSRPVPKLVANQAPPRRAGELFPLGVSVHDASNGASLVIGGLASGATLSAGHAAADNMWRLTASDLNNVVIQPLQNFAGAMDLTVELRMADETVSDRRFLHFEWAAPAVAEMMTRGDAIHHLDPNEIASLLKRGDDLIASGDLAAARLVLRPAADAGDAHAATTLGGTYDPVILEKLSVHGFVPDVAMARGWYEKAKKFGSADAPRRLEMLARKPQ